MFTRPQNIPERSKLNDPKSEPQNVRESEMISSWKGARLCRAGPVICLPVLYKCPLSKRLRIVKKKKERKKERKS